MAWLFPLEWKADEVIVALDFVPAFGGLEDSENPEDEQAANKERDGELLETDDLPCDSEDEGGVVHAIPFIIADVADITASCLASSDFESRAKSALFSSLSREFSS
jgi:hypothetical protein